MPSHAYTIDTGFGTFEVTEDDIVTFPRGIPGFERCQRFVLLSHETFAPLRCLYAVDGMGAAFLAVDPRSIVPGYGRDLQAEELGQIDAEPETPLVWLALLAFAGEDIPTANLRAPIVINPASMRGLQLVIDDDRYTARHELAA